MLTFLRLTWRLGRWEVAVLIGGPLLFAGIVGFVAWQTSVNTADLAGCYAGASGAPLSASCRSAVDWGNVLTGLGPTLVGATTVVPFIVGILLGAPLVSREIEKRTAPIAWSLSRSRARWLALRAAPLLIAITVVLLLVGQASEALIRARPPGELGFPVFAMHGPLIAARGVAVFCIGVLVGLIMGRMLPAILTAGVVVIALFVGLTLVRGELMRAEATWVPSSSADFSGVLIYGTAYIEDATGTFVSDEEAYARYPEVFGPQGSGTPPGMTQVYLATPPNLYPVFVAREGGALLLVSVLATGAALWVVRSRRPDLG
jgi:ABC-type transport system involved in multi-copper enzyme maturation permease subunit